MLRKNKVKDKKSVRSQSIAIRRYRWAFKMFAVSICLSSLFSILSHSVLNSLGAIIASLMIVLFIFLSVVFDMIGIAVTCADQEFFLQKVKEKKPGSEVALKLKNNSEKVCSFCADVVGDICGILSGAAGACVIMEIAQNISQPSVIVIISTLVSSLIAGLTILFKALMKQRAITNANNIILRLGKIIDKLFFYKKRKKDENLLDN